MGRGDGGVEGWRGGSSHDTLYKYPHDRKTHDQFNLTIFNSPPAKPRLFCPNDFLVYVSGKTDKNLSRQIAGAEQDEGTIGDRFGKVGTIVFVKGRKELDQLRAQCIVRSNCAWDNFWLNVYGGREALNGACTPVVGHVGGEYFAEFGEFFRVKQQVESYS